MSTAGRRSHRLMVVGGGTGGHVFPGVAVAEAWLKNVDDAEVVFVGSPTGMEARVIPPLGHDFIPVEARRLKNAGLFERLKSLFRMPAVIWAGVQLLRREKPAVVLGVGGYVSGPVVLAAALTGRPSAVAEQNARPGLTNRLLSYFVKRIYTAFPEALEHFPRKKVRELGNPVRDAILQCEHAPAPTGPRVLILGGSQGARSLNELLPEAIAQLKAAYPGLVVTHQTGRDRDTDVRATYETLGISDVTVTPFIDDMAGAFAATDFVIARSGATTVAELACIGCPALFIPFPHAADDHQTANADSLVSAGAALMVQERDLDVERLVALVKPLLSEPEQLAEMGRRARERGRPEAADDIVADLSTLAGLGSALRLEQGVAQ